MKKQFFAFLFSVFTSSACLAQDAGNDEDVKQSFHSNFRLHIRVDADIPHPMANAAFRRSFTGTYDGTLSVYSEVSHGFNLGVFYKNAEFEVPANKIAQLYTKQQYNAAGIRLGYDYYISKVTVFSVAINAGQCQMFAYDVIPLQVKVDPHPTDQGFLLEPVLGMSFYTEDDFAIGFNASYEVITNQFDPYKLALDQHGISYSNNDLKGFTQNFNIGFHFVYSFLTKKRKR
ncbi:MAG TPA: hypothetical protein VGO45_09760 [Bacteroidia bacterium]|nr:hypothetical protein [Bacteroidia bacterium]